MNRASQSLQYLSQGVAQPTPAVRLRSCLCAVFCHCKWITGVLPLTQGFMWMKNIKECHSFTFAFAHSYIGISYVWNIPLPKKKCTQSCKGLVYNASGHLQRVYKDLAFLLLLLLSKQKLWVFFFFWGAGRKGKGRQRNSAIKIACIKSFLEKFTM